MFLQRKLNVCSISPIRSFIRPVILCKCNNNTDNLQVFQISSCKHISLHEIESSLITVQGMSYEDKNDYFESLLIKYDNVDKYYNIVKTLNESYYKTSSTEIHTYVLTIIFKILIWLLNSKSK